MKLNGSAIICLVAGCALLWLAGCQEQNTAGGVETTPDQDKTSPTITFEQLGHDFGEVSPSTMNTGRIKFKNTGQGTLKITKVESCCSVVAKLAEDKDEYAPGESGAVELEWRSGSRAIAFGREITIHTNDKANPAVKLALKALIVPKIVLEPERLKLFLNEDNAACPKMTVKCLDDKPFAITAFKSTGDCITADFDPNAEATEFVLEPKVNIEKLHANLKGSVMVGLTHPTAKTAVIYFDVLPEYTVKPLSVFLLDPKPGEPVAKTVELINNYGQDFEIESVSSKEGTVAIKLVDQKKIEGGYKLMVELAVVGDEVPSRFTDEFTISLKQGQKFVIGCRGWSSKKKKI